MFKTANASPARVPNIHGTRCILDLFWLLFWFIPIILDPSSANFEALNTTQYIMTTFILHISEIWGNQEITISTASLPRSSLIEPCSLSHSSCVGQLFSARPFSSNIQHRKMKPFQTCVPWSGSEMRVTISMLWNCQVIRFVVWQKKKYGKNEDFFSFYLFSNLMTFILLYFNRGNKKDRQNGILCKTFHCIS